MSTTTIRYIAGAMNRAGDPTPNNVMGDCGHLHRTPEAAQDCIDQVQRGLARQSSGYYCDREVIEVEVIKGAHGRMVRKVGRFGAEA